MAQSFPIQDPAHPYATRRRFAFRQLAMWPILVIALAGCSTVSGVVSSLTPNFSWIYKIDVQQGTVLTREQVEQLKPGMTREQVRFLLGTPALVDVFHNDRWDYPYTMQRRGGPIESRNYTVFFEDNRVKSFAGDPMPSAKEFDEKTTDAAKPAPPPSASPPAPPSGPPAPPTTGPAGS